MNAQVRSLAQQVAQQYGIPWPLFDALLMQESGYADDVIYGQRVSSAGAQGVAQFMPATAAQYGVNPLDPTSALNGAARYLLDMLSYYGGDWEKAVASYNAGAGNVNNAVAQGGANWKDYLPGETKKYLSIIQPASTSGGNSITPPQTGSAGLGAIDPGFYRDYGDPNADPGFYQSYGDPSVDPGFHQVPLAWASTGVTQGFGPGIPQDGPGYWLNPATGQVEYGEHVNKGLDLDVPEGMPIQTPVGGRVTVAHDDGSGWGPRVEIVGDDGLIYNFGHLLGASVKVGDIVQPGQVISPGVDPGKAGTSTGRHLSFDVMRPDGVFVDPRPAIQLAQTGVPTFGDFMASGTEATQQAIRSGALPPATNVTMPNVLGALLDKALMGTALTPEEAAEVIRLAGAGAKASGIPEGASTEGLPEGSYWDPVTGLPTKAETTKDPRNFTQSDVEGMVKDGTLTGNQAAYLWGMIQGGSENVNPELLAREQEELRALKPDSVSTSYTFTDAGQGLIRINSATGEAYYIGPDGNPVTVSPALDPNGTEQGRFQIQKLGDGTTRISDKTSGLLSAPFKLPAEAQKLDDLTAEDFSFLLDLGMPIEEVKREFRKRFGGEMTTDKLSIEIGKLEKKAKEIANKAPYTPDQIVGMLDAGIITPDQARMYMERTTTDPNLMALNMKRLDPGAKYTPTQVTDLYEAGLISQDQAEQFMASIYGDDPLLLELAMKKLQPGAQYSPTDIAALVGENLMSRDEATQLLSEQIKDPRMLELALRSLPHPYTPTQINQMVEAGLMTHEEAVGLIEQMHNDPRLAELAKRNLPVTEEMIAAIMAQARADYEAQGMDVYDMGEGVLKVEDPATGNVFTVGYVPERGKVEQSAPHFSSAVAAKGIKPLADRQKAAALAISGLKPQSTAFYEEFGRMPGFEELQAWLGGSFRPSMDPDRAQNLATLEMTGKLYRDYTAMTPDTAALGREVNGLQPFDATEPVLDEMGNVRGVNPAGGMPVFGGTLEMQAKSLKDMGHFKALKPMDRWLYDLNSGLYNPEAFESESPARLGGVFMGQGSDSLQFAGVPFDPRNPDQGARIAEALQAGGISGAQESLQGPGDQAALRDVVRQAQLAQGTDTTGIQGRIDALQQAMSAVQGGDMQSAAMLLKQFDSPQQIKAILNSAGFFDMAAINQLLQAAGFRQGRGSFYRPAPVNGPRIQPFGTTNRAPVAAQPQQPQPRIRMGAPSYA